MKKWRVGPLPPSPAPPLPDYQENQRGPPPRHSEASRDGASKGGLTLTSWSRQSIEGTQLRPLTSLPKKIALRVLQRGRCGHAETRCRPQHLCFFSGYTSATLTFLIMMVNKNVTSQAHGICIAALGGPQDIWVHPLQSGGFWVSWPE